MHWFLWAVHSAQADHSAQRRCVVVRRGALVGIGFLAVLCMLEPAQAQAPRRQARIQPRPAMLSGVAVAIADLASTLNEEQQRQIVISLRDASAEATCTAANVQEMAPRPSACADDMCWAELGRRLQCAYVLAASILSDGDELVLSLSLIESRSGRRLAMTMNSVSKGNDVGLLEVRTLATSLLGARTLPEPNDRPVLPPTVLRQEQPPAPPTVSRAASAQEIPSESSTEIQRMTEALAPPLRVPNKPKHAPLLSVNGRQEIAIAAARCRQGDENACSMLSGPANKKSAIALTGLWKACDKNVEAACDSVARAGERLPMGAGARKAGGALVVVGGGIFVLSAIGGGADVGAVLGLLPAGIGAAIWLSGVVKGSPTRYLKRQGTRTVPPTRTTRTTAMSGKSGLGLQFTWTF